MHDPGQAGRAELYGPLALIRSRGDVAAVQTLGRRRSTASWPARRAGAGPTLRGPINLKTTALACTEARGLFDLA